MENAVILHISDLHHGPNQDPRAPGFREHDDLTREKITEEFLTAVQNLNPKPNLIIVTGDLTWEALDTEFNDAIVVLERLALTLDINSSKNIIIVPGNHDASSQLFQYNNTYEFFPYFKFYSKLKKEYSRDFFHKEDPENIFKIHDLVNEFGVIIIVFNSNIKQNANDDPKERKGWLGRLQVRTALNRAKEMLSSKFDEAIKIAVFHHNALPDAKGNTFYQSPLAMRDLHNSEIDIVLHGHSHRNSYDVLNGIHSFGVSALGVNTKYRPIDQPLGFQCIEIPSVRRIRADSNELGYLKLHLNADQRWIPEGNREFKAFEKEIDTSLIRLYDFLATRKGKIAASVLLLDQELKSFWLTFNSVFNAWLCPGEAVEPGELPHDCAVRAVREKVCCGVEFLDVAHDPNTEISLDDEHWIVPKPVLAVVESQFTSINKDFPFRCNYYYVGFTKENPDDIGPRRPGSWFTLEKLRRKAAEENKNELVPTDLPNVIEKILNILAINK